MQKDSKIKVIGNLELHQDENYVVLSLNPKIYPLDIIYSAAYVLMDKIFVVIDGDPKEEIIVELRPKDKKKDLEELGRDFNNELLNYAVYKIQSEKSKEIKDTIVKRALLTNEKCVEEQDFEESIEEKPEEIDEEESYIDDPLGIAKPWEETHKEEK